MKATITQTYQSIINEYMTENPFCTVEECINANTDIIAPTVRSAYNRWKTKKKKPKKKKVVYDNALNAKVAVIDANSKPTVVTREPITCITEKVWEDSLVELVNNNKMTPTIVDKIRDFLDKKKIITEGNGDDAFDEEDLLETISLKD